MEGVLTGNSPIIVLAGPREANASCAHCREPLKENDATAICRACGGVHHLACWQQGGGCGAYECAECVAKPMVAAPALVISHAELAAAQPLPPAPARTEELELKPETRPRNRAANWALGIAILGIPLFGLVTGLIAIVVACVALAGYTPRRGGLPQAVGAILIGLLDVVGWGLGLSSYMGGGAVMVPLADMTLDPESLKGMPERIARAMRANVLIQANFGLGQAGIGSGVILEVRDDTVLIVTNRHVIDHHYANSPADAAPADLDKMAPISVMTVEQSVVPGTVEWVAPHGVDLAIVSASLPGDFEEIRAAKWNVDAPPHVGDPVFAVGNPHGLGWTHSAGSVSQIRRRDQDGYSLKVLQSTAAFNPGNSGGGLYDADGQLIGINTLTGDHRVAEGLGFSIAISALVDLAPERLALPTSSVEAKQK